MIMADVIAMFWADVIVLFLFTWNILTDVMSIWQWTVIDLFWWLMLFQVFQVNKKGQ